MIHEPARIALQVIAGLLLLSVTYAVSYCAMLESPNQLYEQRLSIGGIEMPLHREPAYRFGSEAAKEFFRPCHAIDRLLRPGYWLR